MGAEREHSVEIQWEEGGGGRRAGEADIESLIEWGEEGDRKRQIKPNFVACSA